jgi:hypothetical protein
MGHVSHKIMALSRIAYALIIAVCVSSCESDYSFTVTPGNLSTISTSPSSTPSICTAPCTVPDGVGTEVVPCSSPSPAPSASPSPGVCTLTMCNTGYVPKNGVCVPVTSSTPFSCTTYVQLNLDSNNTLNVPAQDAIGTCYYYPIVDMASPLTGGSSLTGNLDSNHDQDVLSRDHDVDAGNSADVWHPYIMDQSQFLLNFAGPRAVVLTGGSTAIAGSFLPSDISIDNFFLVGVYPQNVNLTTSNLSAYYSSFGTGDSPVGVNGVTTNGVAFNPAGIDLTTNASETYTYATGNETVNYSTAGVVTDSAYVIVPLTVEAPGGTAQIPQVTLTNDITPNVPTTMDFRALDCGGSRYLGNIYLLIQ